MSDSIFPKVLDSIGKVFSEALKGITDPFVRIAFALMVILNFIGFGMSFGMLIRGNSTLAFIALMVMILVDFIIVILLILKRTSKMADINAQAAAYNSIYQANAQMA
jgi:hypothetical protein